jgi:hypothetical protein
MDKPRELYHEEVSNLEAFQSKLDSHAIFKDDLVEFSEQYEDLVIQAKVITRVSDRLQKKLDKANTQIREKNEEITDKNVELEETVEQLAKARVGKRASTIMLFTALGLFFAEQLILEPIIKSYVSIPNLSLVVLVILFFSVKFLEGRLEGYFMDKEKKKIISQEKSMEFNASMAG